MEHVTWVDVACNEETQPVRVPLFALYKIITNTPSILLRPKLVSRTSSQK